LDSSNKPLILIAEDDAAVSMIVEDILTEAGFRFLAVVNAEEAITALEDRPDRFSALVTDIRMPGEANGWDVARRGRELQPVLPIIYMTADSAAQWTAHGVPGSVLLQKPFVSAQLVTALTNLLNEADTAGIGK
jgi:CheY-like chemotaxis protein